MICQSCNEPIGSDVRFCPKCGAPVVLVEPPRQNFVPGYPSGYAPGAGPRLRVTRHLQILGTLWCVFGAYRILSGVLGMFFLRTFAMHGFGNGGWPFGGYRSPFPEGWMGFLLPVIATVTVVSAAFAFVTGYGLLTRRPWGRIIGIIAAVLALFKFPLGTAMGIYTLWVLAPGESSVEYDAITSQTARP